MSRQRRASPAVDPAIGPALGQTRDGQALSYNRAPAPDLAPWIGRLQVTKIELPDNYVLNCGLFDETAALRIQLTEGWSAVTADGTTALGHRALFCGPQTRRMPVSVTGSVINLGMSIRAGASTALGGPRLSDFIDRVVPIEAATRASGRLALNLFKPDDPPETWITILEDLVRIRVREREGALPDPVATQFELLTMSDPSISVAQAARECDVDRRRLERIVHRDFGMSPKQVLRRARALDMASHLRGVADGAEGEEISLRYYDDSHLIREFTELFGMSPRQFVERPQPILTLTLEIRQARRLEMLKRIEPGMTRPWQ